MNPPDKAIILSFHAREQCKYRGCSEAEVTETIQTAPWKSAELGRSECQKDFTFNQIWNGKSYHTKQVRPIFADEADGITVVTVYVYYF